MNRAILGNPIVHLALVAALGLLAYSNTFDVPFHWDDHAFIERNSAVKNIDYFISP